MIHSAAGIDPKQPPSIGEILIMRRSIIVLLAIVSSFGADVAKAANDGRELLRRCEKAVATAETGAEAIADNSDVQWCLGFVRGFTQMNNWYRMEGKSELFCGLGDGLQDQYAAEVLVEYLRNHPELLKMKDGALALAAFVDRFPCKSGLDESTEPPPD